MRLAFLDSQLGLFISIIIIAPFSPRLLGEKLRQPLNSSLRRPHTRTRNQAPPNPSRQLSLNPRRLIPPINHQDSRIIINMSNSSPNTLIHSSHARILVKVPPSRSRTGFLLCLCTRVLLVRLFLYVIDLSLPDCAADVGEW